MNKINNNQNKSIKFYEFMNNIFKIIFIRKIINNKEIT